MITVPATLTATAQSVAEIVKSSLDMLAQDMVGDRDDLRANVIIQSLSDNASDVGFGSATDQSGFLVAGGSMNISRMNLNKTYLVGNGLGVVIHLLD
jgi:hypothetical protein